MDTFDDEIRDTLRLLMAHASAILERAHEFSIDGQSNLKTMVQFEECATLLLTHIRDAQSLATAADAISRNAPKTAPTK